MKVQDFENRIPHGVQLLHVRLAKNEVRIALARNGNESIVYTVVNDNIKVFTRPFPDERQTPLEIVDYEMNDSDGTLNKLNGILYREEHIRYKLL